MPPIVLWGSFARPDVNIFNQCCVGIKGRKSKLTSKALDLMKKRQELTDATSSERQVLNKEVKGLIKRHIWQTSNKQKVKGQSANDPRAKLTYPYTEETPDSIYFAVQEENPLWIPSHASCGDYARLSLWVRDTIKSSANSQTTRAKTSIFSIIPLTKFSYWSKCQFLFRSKFFVSRIPDILLLNTAGFFSMFWSHI